MLLPEWLTHRYIEGNEGLVGSIAGNIVISGKQAVAEYAAVRAANAQTIEALTSSSAVFAKVGTLTLGAAAGIAALFGVAIDQAAKFEKKIDYFGAVTNATQADMDAVAAKAIAMSKTTIYSADQMADAFVEFGKAGIATQDILGGVADSTAALAQAADINITDASNIIVSTMSQFNISAQDSIHIANELAGAANASIIDISDLGTSLKYVGGIAEAAGVPFESVVDAIALLGNAGLKGSIAGTTLRQIMVSLTGPTAAATKEMKTLGIITADGTNAFIDQTGKLKPLDQIFQILKEHTEGLTQAQTLAATKTLFNSRALAGANILLEDGAAGFAQMNAAISDTSAAEVAGKRLDNLAGDVTKLKNAIQTMLIQAGGPLQDTMRMVVQHLTDAVRWFGDLNTSTQQTIINVLLGVAAFLAIIGTLSLVISLVLKVILVFNQLYRAFILLKAGMMMIRDAAIMMNIAMDANPIFLIIMAVVALVAILIFCWFHFKTFREIVIAVLVAIKNAAVAAWHGLEIAFKAIVAAAEATWHGLQSAFDFVKDMLQTAAKWVWDYFVNPIIQAFYAVRDALVNAYNWVVRIINDILGWVEKHWRLLLAIFLGPLGLLIDAITNHLDWCARLFNTVWTAISNFVKFIWGIIYNSIVTVVSTIQGWLAAAWSAIWSVIQTVWNAIVSYFQMQWNLIVLIFTTAFNFLWLGITTLWDAIVAITTTVWNAIYAFMAPIVKAIADVIMSIFNGLKSAVSTVWDGITSIISSAFNNVIGPISNAIKAAIQGIKDVVNELGNIWNSIWNWIKQVINDVWNFVKPILDKITGAIDKIAGGISTVVGGISSAGGAVSDFFGFAEGGGVPGRKGQPQFAIVHGGEFVLSNDMLAGKAKIPSNVLSALAASQLANTAARNSLMSMAANSGSVSGSAFAQPSTASLQAALSASSNTSSEGRSMNATIINNYPKPEQASENLPRSIRNAGYVLGGSR